MRGCFCALIVVVLAAAGVVSCMADDQTDNKVADLVAKLGSDSFEERETAQAQLEFMGPAILPQLEKCLAGATDAEVKMRLEATIGALREPVKTYLAKRHPEYADLKRIEDDTVAKILPGVELWGTTLPVNERRNIRPEKKKLALAFLPATETAKSEVRELLADKDIIKLFTDRKVNVKDAKEEQVRDAAYVAVLIFRLGAYKGNSVEALPRPAAGDSENWPDKQAYKVTAGAEGTIVGGIVMWIGTEEVTLEVVFTGKGELSELKLTKTGKVMQLR